jgi:hypothetical protein
VFEKAVDVAVPVAIPDEFTLADQLPRSFVPVKLPDQFP